MRSINFNREEVKDCNCDYPYNVLEYTSYILGVPVLHTIMCLSCRSKKVSRFTRKSAIKAWNKKVGRHNGNK